jgi:hypothetical protein
MMNPTKFGEKYRGYIDEFRKSGSDEEIFEVIRKYESSSSIVKLFSELFETNKCARYYAAKDHVQNSAFDAREKQR